MSGNDVQRLHYWAFALSAAVVVVSLWLMLVGIPAARNGTAASTGEAVSSSALKILRRAQRKGKDKKMSSSKTQSAAMAGSTALLATSIFVLDAQTVLWLTTTLCLVMLLAYATNPGEASLRSHLTDVMLQNHIKHFQKLASVSAAQTADDDYNADGDPPLSTFVNRVSISLKTPTYLRHDLGVLSIVLVPTIDYVTPTQPSRLIGVFGKWWTCSGAAADAVSHLVASSTEVRNSTSNCGVLDIRPSDISEATEAHTLDRRRRDAENAEARATSRADEPNESLINSLESGSSAEREPSHAQARGSPLQQRDVTKETTIASIEAPGEVSLVPPREPNAEAQGQLDNIRSQSDVTRKSLQTQLDDLRTRKKDEDATRLDVKTRMKTLDEHKRNAEGTRREAERRLKAATHAQELLKNRIETKVQQMRDLRTKLAAKEKRAKQSATHKDERVAAITQQLADHQKDSEEVDDHMSILQRRIESLEQQILSEEGNLQAANEMAAERSLQEEHLAAQNWAAMEHFAQEPFYQYPGPSGYGGSYDQQDATTSDPAFTSHPSWTEMHMQTPESQVHAVPSLDARHYGQRDDSISAFDPTVAPAPIRAAHAAPPLRFSPFSFDNGSAITSKIEDPRDQPDQPMMTPGTADLLPSNLFQGTDDDDEGAHAGSLLSEDSVLDKLALQYRNPTRGDDADGPSDPPGKGSEELPPSTSNKSARSWWGGRPKSKAGSSIISTESDGRKQVHGEEAEVTEAQLDSSQPVASKRRSLSIFPKMSLNPGAKSFRGPLKRIEQDNLATARSSFENGPSFDSEGFNGDWNASLSSLPSSQNDYEAMKRAFEAGDTTSPRTTRHGNWGSLEGKGWPLSHRIFGPKSSHLSGEAGAPRSSSDSMKPTQTSLGATDASAGWLDDIVLPLERTSSLGSHRSVEAGPTGSPAAPRASKPSRFALFSGFNAASRSSHSNEDPFLSGRSGDEAEGTSSQDPATAATSTPTRSITPGENGTGPKSKRASFRWTRKHSEAGNTMSPFTERTPSRERNDKS